jgi:glycosyltransferase involved in cell wall biosynthesis
VSAANAPGAAGNSSRILAMLWHSPYEFVVSGGFRRTQEILKRVPACIEVLAIDSSPTMLEETGSLKVIEYRFPAWIRRLDRRFFFAIRLLEWFCALASMVAVCVRLWMRGERFDAVYVPSSEIIPALAAGIFAKYLFRCRLVPCNTNIEYYPPVVRRLLAWMHNRSDQVITLSMDLERSLRRNGVRAPVALNAVGLDLDVIEECLSGADSSKDYEAVFIGRHDQSKGILDLLEAWGLVTERLPRARLVTIGTMTPMYAPRVRQLIEKHGLEERVLVLDGSLRRARSACSRATWRGGGSSRRRPSRAACRLSFTTCRYTLRTSSRVRPCSRSRQATSTRSPVWRWSSYPAGDTRSTKKSAPSS